MTCLQQSAILTSGSNCGSRTSPGRFREQARALRAAGSLSENVFYWGPASASPRLSATLATPCRGAQWRTQSSAHRFLHERTDRGLFSGGQFRQSEGDRPQVAFVEVRRVVETDRHVL